MRTRTCVIVAVLVALVLGVPSAQASQRAVLAQEGEVEGQEGQDQPGEEEGQSEPEAETGAGEGETQEATEEAGPPWTYQMARLGLLLLLALFLGMGALYYRFVVLRARGEV